MLEGGVGVYDAASGCVDYEVHEKRPGGVSGSTGCITTVFRDGISWATFSLFRWYSLPFPDCSWSGKKKMDWQDAENGCF